MAKLAFDRATRSSSRRAFLTVGAEIITSVGHSSDQETTDESIQVAGAAAPVTREAVWNPTLLRSPHATPDKAERVRRMFNAIAPRYELVNSLFSGGRDRYWRRKAVELARVSQNDKSLDIACGTGDFTRAFALAKPACVIGCDFAHEMLTRTRESDRTTILWCECDALRLPFPDRSFSITSCAFGVRNWSDLDAGLREMHRVLQPGGRAVILEFSQPANAFVRRLHNFYSGRLMPIAATLVSGDKTGAYHYLPRSVQSFVSGDEMVRKLRAAGFDTVSAHPLTFGVVTVYIAYRAG